MRSIPEEWAYKSNMLWSLSHCIYYRYHSRVTPWRTKQSENPAPIPIRSELIGICIWLKHDFSAYHCSGIISNLQNCNIQICNLHTSDSLSFIYYNRNRYSREVRTIPIWIILKISRILPSNDDAIQWFFKYWMCSKIVYHQIVQESWAFESQNVWLQAAN